MLNPAADDVQREAARRYLDTARAEAGQGPEWPSVPGAAPLRTAAVVGAGTMGAGIAQCLIGAGLATRLFDRDAAALQRGVQRIRASLDKAHQRGELGADALDRRLALLQPTSQWEALAGADVVIEAVPESPAIKHEVLHRLGTICAPGAWFASNTSTLDIDALGQACGRPAQLLGMHFLTPAHVTPLLEVVRGAATNARTLAAAAELTRRIGKIPVQTGNAWGFIGNRLFEGYLSEVDMLLLGGVPPEHIDAALQDFGFALGPCRTLDMAGLDISAQVVQARAAMLPDGLPPTRRLLTRRLAELGRLGVKSGRGHYLYDGRVPKPDPELAALAAEAARSAGVAPLPPLTDAEIVQRCLRPLVEEGRAVLAEGVALRASDVDLVWVLGYGFPAHRGGPMFMAGH